MVLPHACFVYDAIYHSSMDHVILTAGYDKLIYVWTVQSTESRYGQVYSKELRSINIVILLCHLVFAQIIWSPWLHQYTMLQWRR